VVEVQTYSYDSPPSPWPDIPAIPQWQRMKNPIFIDSRTIEYLPQGNTTEAFSRKEFEYRYDKENRVVEVLISEPSTRDELYEFHYSCELAEP